MIEVWIKLIIAHALSDGAFQTVWMGKTKGKNTNSGLFALLSHALVVAGVFYLFFPFTWVFLIVGISHFLIDGFTSRVEGDHVSLIDQSLHAIVIIIIGVILYGKT